MQQLEGDVAFGPFRVDLETRQLTCGAESASLQDKPLRLLLALLERPGRVVLRERLYDALWPAEIHVDREAGLNTAVRKLRAALREVSGSEEDFLQTVPRAGYRLVVPPMKSASGTAERAEGLGWPRLAAVAALLVFATALALSIPGRTTRTDGDVVRAEAMPEAPDQRARYVEARSLIGTAGPDLVRARDLLRTLTRELPRFAPAHAYLAEACARLAVPTGETAHLDEARLAAHRALELDARSAVAHRVLSMIALTFDWDTRTSAERLERSLAIDPGDPVTHLADATLHSVLGKHDLAIQAVRRAVDLEPESMALRSDAGHFLLRAGRFEEAAVECEMALRLDAENAYAPLCLLTAYSATGDVEAARPHALRLLERAEAPGAEIDRAAADDDPRRVYLEFTLARLLDRADPSAVRVATHYLELGERAEAIHWLEVAARQRSPLLIFVPHHAGYPDLRAEPRYREIFLRAGLEPFTEGPSPDPAHAT